MTRKLDMGEREKNTDQDNVKFTTEEKERLARACDRSGVKRGQYIRTATLLLLHQHEKEDLIKVIGRILGAL